MTTTPAMPELPEPSGVIVVGTQALRAFTADQMDARYLRGYNDALATLQAQPAEVSDAAMKDAVFEASIEFIGTLTGMQPPPIETAPPEVFKPFRDFTEKVCAILSPRMHASASAAGQATPQADPLNPGWCVGCDPENCIGCGIGLNEPQRATLQAQPAEVSDAQIRRDANLPFVEDEQGAEWVTLSPAMFARAVRRVLALRPQSVPMTREQRRTLVGNYFAEAWSQNAAFGMLDDYDKHHGITAPAGGEKQA